MERFTREIAPLVFREVHGQSVLAFVKDSSGKFVMGADYPFEVGTQTSALTNGMLNIGLVSFAVIVFALTVLAWPITAMVRKPFGSRAFGQARLSWFSDDDNFGPTERAVPGYTMLDAGGGYRIVPQVELRLQGRQIGRAHV